MISSYAGVTPIWRLSFLFKVASRFKLPSLLFCNTEWFPRHLEWVALGIRCARFPGRLWVCLTGQVHLDGKVPCYPRAISAPITCLSCPEVFFPLIQPNFVSSATGSPGSPIFGALSVFDFAYSPTPRIRYTGIRILIIHNHSWQM